MVALLLLPLLLPSSDWRWSAILRIPSALGPLLVFWACCALSIVGVALSPGAESSVGQFLRTFVHLSAYVVFVIVVVRWITWPRLFLLVKTYYAVGVAAAVLALVQYVHGAFGLFDFLAPLRLKSFDYEIGRGLTAGFRTASFFGEPSWAARYYIHFLALALAFWWQTRRLRHLAAVILFMLAFYTANSILGYVILGSFLFAAGLAQMWRHNMFTLGRRQKLGTAAVAYLLLLMWLTGLAPRMPDLIDRSIIRIGLIMEGGGAAGNRIDSVFAGLAVWKLAPIVGIGLGNIDRYIVPFYQDPAWVIRSYYGSDSLYIQIMAETGVIGLAAWLWFFARLLWFSAPAGFLSQARPESARAFGWMRFLQLDMFAQGVGMFSAADYLNPHLWTVVAIVLACKVLIVREGRLLPVREAGRVPVGHGPIPGFAMS